MGATARGAGKGCDSAGGQDSISKMILANWKNVLEKQDAPAAHVRVQTPPLAAEMQDEGQPGRSQLREEESGGYSELQTERDPPRSWLLQHEQPKINIPCVAHEPCKSP